MPYKILSTDDGFFVVNTDTGEKKNKEPMPKAEANKYMRALYAAEGETAKEFAGYTLKDDSHEGIMLAFSVPAEIAATLALDPQAVPGGEVIPADELHITLVYLGTIQDQATTPAELLPLLSMFALSQAPIRGVYNGYGRFVMSHKDGLEVCYLNFDSPELPDFHHALVQALEETGLEFETQHGFTPHTTLAYVPEGQESPETPELPVDVTFDRFVLAYGDQWYEFYLTGKEAETALELPNPIQGEAQSTYKETVTKIGPLTIQALEDKLDDFRRAFYAQLELRPNAPYPESDCWLVKTYPGFVIVSKSNASAQEFYKVPYVMQADQPVFAERDHWTPVEKVEEWVELARKEAKRRARPQVLDNLIQAISSLITEKHLAHDQKRHGFRGGVEGLREFAKARGLTIRDRGAEHGKNRYEIRGHGGKTNMRAGGITSAKKLIRSANKNEIEAKRSLQRAKDEAKAKGYVSPEKKQAAFAEASRLQGEINSLMNVQAANRPLKGYYKPSENKRRQKIQDETQAKIDKLVKLRNAQQKIYMAPNVFNEMFGAQKEYPVLSRIVDALTGLYNRNKVFGSEGFITFKEKNGGYRWVSFSSNPYRDRDRQYVSLKALQADVARADSDGQYGPLLWWHTGVKLGDCDYNAMIGKILVESGTFTTPEIGAAVSRKADQMQVSIGMLHPLDQPDSDGVFTLIRRYERSILPSGRASNPLTGFLVKESITMENVDPTKEAQLVQMLGPDLAKTVIGQALTIQKQADDMGIAFKEKADPETEEDEETPEDGETPVTAKAKYKAFEGDMGELATLIAGAVTLGMAPAVKELKDEMAALRTASTQKEDTTATVKNTQDAQALEIKRLSEQMTAQQMALTNTQKELASKIKNIMGDVPPAIADLMAHRPSQDTQNTVTKEKVDQVQPTPSGFDSFLEFAAPHVKANA